MKRVISMCLVAVLIVSVIPLSSCGQRPPDIEDVYDRLVELIEDAHEVNVLLFGAGLPVYPRGSEEDELIHRYYGTVDNGQEYVSSYAKYGSIEEMKTAIAQVYSQSYAESLYETLFTGYASDVSSDTVLPARYTEDERWMYQNSYVKPLVTGMRVYDYATMTIVSPSNATYLKVELQSYSEDTPGEWMTVDLSFIYENNNWYLDGPSC